MKITYTAKNVTLRDNFKERVEKKLKKYERVFSENAEVKVTVNLYKNRQTVEITIKDNGMVYRVETSCPEMNDALDTDMDKLGRQIRKNKTKLEKRLRPAALEVFDDEDSDDDTDETPEEVTYNILRTKTVALKPMSPDEAILRMNMVNHKFFMFLNSKTDKICVVYIRDNGDYGMLESEIDE
ncbi:MAG: ribosome-associated translation inhibitor RaiA [Acutalibacteraceae bacterium]|nr:ribosome-associated translation inhibitor RaiA [Clostridia bacterium]MEE3450915.1 ribosome-associated translation inhibitor RaiA [Acutalibacteraceae bacterium]